MKPHSTLRSFLALAGSSLLAASYTHTLGGANTYTGGTMLVDNTTGSGTGTGNISVSAGTLGGTGIITGSVSIGNSIDSIDSGALTFNSDGSYACELNGTSVTSDQANVTGKVAINAGTTLAVTLTGSLAPSQKYVIAINDGVDAVTGTFASFAPRGRWNKPFNDTYINYSCDGLPIHNRISDIAGCIANIAEAAILREGGKKIKKDVQIIYVFKDGKGA